MNYLNRKRNRDTFQESSQDCENNQPKALQISSVLNSLKRNKLNTQNSGKKIENSVTVKIKDLVQVDRGFFNLPKEVIEEGLALNFKVIFKPRRDNGDQTYYYSCNHPGCFYRLKIREYPDLIKNITLSAMISNFKKFDLSVPSELEEGICHLTEYGNHKDNHQKEQNNKNEFNKAGLFYS